MATDVQGLPRMSMDCHGLPLIATDCHRVQVLGHADVPLSEAVAAATARARSRLEAQGFSCFETQVGGHGVLWHADADSVSSATSEPAAEPAAPAFDLKALKEQEAAEMKKKIEENALKAKQKEKEEDERIAKMQALEAQGVKVAGGMHKFDASEVDVHGGNATADDFLDAFGM